MSAQTPSGPDPSPRRWPWVLLWLALAAGYTGLMLDWSFEHGRLALPPDWDDSVYMLDALYRLDTLEAEGLGAFVGTYTAKRPHAPLSTALAVTGYGVLGRHDWVVYAMNGVLLFLLLLAVDHLMRDTWIGARILAGVFVLALRMTGMLVTEFRPDVAVGLLSAFGVALLFRDPLAVQTRRRWIGIGLCFGAALLAKPSVSPVTVGILGLACGAMGLRELGARTHARPLRAALRTSAWIAGTAILVALPHYLVHGHAIANYIWQGIWGSARVLGEAHLSTADSLRYYIDGYGGRLMLRSVVWLIAALTLACTAWLVRHRRWGALRTVAAYGLVTVVVYGVITWNHVKTQFLGSPFFALLLFGSILLLRGIVQQARAKRIPGLAARLAIGTVAGLAVYCFNYPPIRALPDDFASRNATLRGVYEAIEEQRTPESRVFFTSIALVNRDVVLYWQRRERKAVAEIMDTPLVNEWERFEGPLERATLVVASEPGNSEDLAHLVDPALQQRMLEWLRADPRYTQVASVPTPSGHAYRLFRRDR